MSSLSPIRYERVREDMLPHSLREVTEDPGLGQLANLARRAASFKKNREDLDNAKLRKAAARAAADKRKDDELRVKLNSLADTRSRPSLRAARIVTSGVARSLGADEFIPPAQTSRSAQQSASTQLSADDPLNVTLPQTASDGAPISTAMSSSNHRPPLLQPTAAEMGDNSRLVDRTRSKQTHVTAAFTRTKSTGVQISPTKSPSAEQPPGEHGYARSDPLEAGRLERGSLIRHQSHPRISARTRRLIPDSEGDDESFDEQGSVTNNLGVVSPDRTRASLRPPHQQPDQEVDDPSAASTLLSQLTDRHKCTRKHFRVKRIVGRQVIDGETWYEVRWRRSWVPSHLIVRSENGRGDFIEIDGKDWYIKEIIKSKIKKGIHKQLVRWADDTQEPLRHLGKALGAVEAFENTPKLNRRVLTFHESLLDQRTILPQSEDHFREAQLHLAKNWPIIEPRNDIDLLPALRQIILEDPERPRNDRLMHRKTHFRLIDLPQVRSLRWNEAYILSGRRYECTLPRRNALLLQVVGDTEGNTCCERCLGSTSPFAECVMDNSDEDPWFNGGCANCGAFEANSACIHHNKGRQESEGRGSTVGAPKGLTRESRAALSQGNLGLRESLFRLRYLDYDNGSDSETYSADSYNSSDESADTSSDIDDHEKVDESEPLFCTPDSQTGNSHTIFARAPDSWSSVDARSMEEERLPQGRAERPGALRRIKKGRQNLRRQGITGLPMPAEQRRAGSAACADYTLSVTRGAARGRGPFSHYDNSLSMSAEQDRLPAGNDDSRNFGVGDDFGDDESFDPPDGGGDSTEPEMQTSGPSATEASLSSISETATNMSLPVLQSIETVDRRSAAVHINASLSANSPRTTVSTVSKKRASSQPPMHERPPRRSLSSSFGSFASTFSQTPLAVGNNLPERPHLSQHSGRVKEEGGRRRLTHPCCFAYRPCMHPDNFTARSEHPLVEVYSNEIDESRPMTVGQAEFIISRCTCHWSDGFTEVWADAQYEFGNLSKAEVLLALFENNLWRAARECCPPRPGGVECIVIDD